MCPRHTSPRFWLSYAIVITSIVWCATVRAAQEVAILLSEDAPAHREVAETIRAELRGVAGVQIILASAFADLPRGELQAVVAVGAKAARAASGETRLPVLNVLLPRRAFERIAAENRRTADVHRYSAVFLDQAPKRQLDLIRLALPGATRVALLLGEESEPLYAAFKDAAVEKRLSISAQKANAGQDIFPALQKLLDEADVLLAMPDPAVFSSATIPNILLTTYRRRVPVVGFSASYVRAGAVLALYSSPAQIGAQAADMVRTALATGQLPSPQYPRQFIVDTNPYVARSLGLAIESAAALEEKLRRAGVQ